MKKKLTPEQQFYHDLVDALLPYADMQLEVIKDKLTPGTTYSAADIVKTVGLSKYDTPRAERIETQKGPFAIASWNIFKQFKMCEKHAGLTGKNAHTWTVSDSREVAATANLSFGPKRQMNDLASMMKKRTRYEYEIIVLSLADGCIRPIINQYRYSPDDPRFRLQAQGYEVPQEFSNLSFKISWQQLKEMYGECRLYIYKDAEPDMSYHLNPYHVRIVIENAEGKCISSDEVIPLTEQFLKLYDSEYTSSYETDYMPPKATEVIEAQHTDAPSSQSETKEPSETTIAISTSSENEYEDLLNAPDGSDSKDCPTNVLPGLEPPHELNENPLYLGGIITYVPPTPEERQRLLETQQMNSPAYPPDSAPDPDIYIEHTVKKLIISRNQNE